MFVLWPRTGSSESYIWRDANRWEHRASASAHGICIYDPLFPHFELFFLGWEQIGDSCINVLAENCHRLEVSATNQSPPWLCVIYGTEFDPSTHPRKELAVSTTKKVTNESLKRIAKRCPNLKFLSAEGVELPLETVKSFPRACQLLLG